MSQIPSNYVLAKFQDRKRARFYRKWKEISFLEVDRQIRMMRYDFKNTRDE